MFEPAKDCSAEDCRIIDNGYGTTTCMYYPPVYDKHGNNLNPDMNSTSYPKKCITCGKEWVEVWRNGQRYS